MAEEHFVDSIPSVALILSALTEYMEVMFWADAKTDQLVGNQLAWGLCFVIGKIVSQVDVKANEVIKKCCSRMMDMLSDCSREYLEIIENSKSYYGMIHPDDFSAEVRAQPHRLQSYGLFIWSFYDLYFFHTPPDKKTASIKPLDLISKLALHIPGDFYDNQYNNHFVKRRNLNLMRQLLSLIKRPITFEALPTTLILTPIINRLTKYAFCGANIFHSFIGARLDVDQRCVHLQADAKALLSHVLEKLDDNAHFLCIIRGLTDIKDPNVYSVFIDSWVTRFSSVWLKGSPPKSVPKEYKDGLVTILVRKVSQRPIAGAKVDFDIIHCAPQIVAVLSLYSFLSKSQLVKGVPLRMDGVNGQIAKSYLEDKVLVALDISERSILTLRRQMLQNKPVDNLPIEERAVLSMAKSPAEQMRFFTACESVLQRVRRACDCLTADLKKYEAKK